MDEILVHICAPSTSSDDARYQAQVAAISEYLRTTNDNDRQGRHSSQRLASASRLGAEESILGRDQQCLGSSPLDYDETTNPEHPSEVSIHDEVGIDDDQPVLSKTSFENESIGPALLAQEDQTHRDPNHEYDSLESLVSVIPDSQPEQPGLLYEQQQSTQPSIHEHHPPPTPPDVSSKRRRLQVEVENEKTQSGPSILAYETTAIAPSKKTNSPPSLSTTPKRPAKPLTETLLKNLPLQIHPPPPPISSAPFTTHITPTLAMLTERLNPGRTYKPTTQLRDLNTLERGYWAMRIGIVHFDQLSDRPDIDVHTEHARGQSESKAQPSTATKPQDQNDKRIWTAAFFTRFWTFLSEFIGKDARAGWGVWCFLDLDENHLGDPSPVPVTDSSNPAALAAPRTMPPRSNTDAVSVLLKVYTWGEIAMHIYLVLFLASERRIRGLGVQWVDARGEVVIQMP